MLIFYGEEVSPPVTLYIQQKGGGYQLFRIFFEKKRQKKSPGTGFSPVAGLLAALKRYQTTPFSEHFSLMKTTFGDGMQIGPEIL